MVIKHTSSLFLVDDAVLTFFGGGNNGWLSYHAMLLVWIKVSIDSSLVMMGESDIPAHNIEDVLVTRSLICLYQLL